MSVAAVEVDNDKSEFAAEEEELDSPDYSIKHPLQNTWTLWYFENDKSIPWDQNQREIASFDTAEDFWSLYNHIKQASELKQGTDYSLFKKGIKPMWEDPHNEKGGRWLISLEKRQRTSGELDRFWLDVVLCLIGEAFDHSDQICGAVVNIRYKGDKIGVWTADTNNTAAVLEIGRKLKERLHIPPRNIIVYEGHKDAADKTGSSSKILCSL